MLGTLGHPESSRQEERGKRIGERTVWRGAGGADWGGEKGAAGQLGLGGPRWSGKGREVQKVNSLSNSPQNSPVSTKYATRHYDLDNDSWRNAGDAGGSDGDERTKRKQRHHHYPQGPFLRPGLTTITTTSKIERPSNKQRIHGYHDNKPYRKKETTAFSALSPPSSDPSAASPLLLAFPAHPTTTTDLGLKPYSKRTRKQPRTLTPRTINHSLGQLSRYLPLVVTCVLVLAMTHYLFWCPMVGHPILCPPTANPSHRTSMVGRLAELERERRHNDRTGSHEASPAASSLKTRKSRHRQCLVAMPWFLRHATSQWKDRPRVCPVTRPPWYHPTLCPWRRQRPLALVDQGAALETRVTASTGPPKPAAAHEKDMPWLSDGRRSSWLSWNTPRIATTLTILPFLPHLVEDRDDGDATGAVLHKARTTTPELACMCQRPSDDPLSLKGHAKGFMIAFQRVLRALMRSLRPPRTRHLYRHHGRDPPHPRFPLASATDRTMNTATRRTYLPVQPLLLQHPSLQPLYPVLMVMAICWSVCLLVVVASGIVPLYRDR